MEGALTADHWKREGNKKYNAHLYAEALECYTKAIERSGSERVHKDTLKLIYGNRAQAFFKLTEYDKALEDSLKSTEIDPTFSKGFFRTGNTYLKVGRFAEAADQFRKYGEFGDAGGFKTAQEVEEMARSVVTGRECFNKGNYGAAVTALKKVVGMATHDVDLKLMYVDAAFQTSRWDAIIQSLKNNVGDFRFRLNLDLRYALAWAYYSTALWADAERNIQIVREINGGFKEVLALQDRCQKMKSRTEAIKACLASGNWAEATDIIDSAIAIDPESTFVVKQLQVYRCEAYYHRARERGGGGAQGGVGAGAEGEGFLDDSHPDLWDECIAEANKAIDSNPYPWKRSALLVRSGCFERAEEIALALADLERALAIDHPDNNQLEARLRSMKEQLPRSRNYYRALCIDRGAETEKVKSAYRKLVLQYHPDRQPGATEEDRMRNKVKFQEIQEAYDVLSDADKKRRYDAGEYVAEQMGDMNADLSDLPHLYNVACGSPPEDATTYQLLQHKLRCCALWSSVCLLGSGTCPCWSAYLCYHYGCKRWKNDNQPRPSPPPR